MANNAGMRVALGMSGGVDSSVAVAVLQSQGYEVLGVTLVFAHDAAARASADAAREVCGRFGVPHVVADLAAAFERRVVSRFADDCAAGLTPSPCAGCNAAVKLPGLLDIAREHGCGLVATGHYARVGRMTDTGRHAVLCGLDHRKDQSYMLGLLSQDQLARLLLPLGGMTKQEVRSLAAELGLSVADAPDSQDICFAPQGFRSLLEARGVCGEPGPIVNAAGQLLGRHTGLPFYTIGQRKGIGVAGPEPYYVTGKRLAANELVVGTARECRVTGVTVAPPVWQAIDEPDGAIEAMVKLRYRSEPCPCIMEPERSGRFRLRLLSPQPATAPGQLAVLYRGSTVLCAATIEEVGS